MKNLFTVLLTLCLFVPAIAQKSEGKIKYDFKMTGEGMEQMAAFMPQSMEIIFSKKGVVTRIKGGMMETMMGDILVNKEGSYMIKHGEKTVYDMSDATEGQEEEPKPAIEKEDEVIEILGYKCQKYKVISESEVGEVVTYVWVTDEIEIPKQKTGMSSNLTAGNLPGIALKTMSTTMGMTTVLAATEVSTDKQDKAQFEIPKGYTKEKFDPNSLGGMGF